MSLTDGTTTIEPTLWVTSDQAYHSQNRVHELMSGRVAITLGGVTPRRGAIGLLFDSEAAATACVDLHREGKVFQISEPGRPSRGMTYVLAEGGAIEREQLTEYRDLWMIRIDYQEVIE